MLISFAVIDVSLIVLIRNWASVVENVVTVVRLSIRIEESEILSMKNILLAKLQLLIEIFDWS